jgi:hypothetical protein
MPSYSSLYQIRSCYHIRHYFIFAHAITFVIVLYSLISSYSSLLHRQLHGPTSDSPSFARPLPPPAAAAWPGPPGAWDPAGGPLCAALLSHYAAAARLPPLPPLGPGGPAAALWARGLMAGGREGPAAAAAAAAAGGPWGGWGCKPVGGADAWLVRAGSV